MRAVRRRRCPHCGNKDERTITHPFPRGTMNVTPRDVLREVPKPTEG